MHAIIGNVMQIHLTGKGARTLIAVVYVTAVQMMRMQNFTNLSLYCLVVMYSQEKHFKFPQPF